jgi:hypothetical protein
MSRDNPTSVKQCGVCGMWTSRGTWLPSGNRDPRTGQTPHDNVVCPRCRREAENLRLVREALERHEKYPAA